MNGQKKESSREQLDRELKELTFSAREQVIKRTHPRFWHEKLAAWWNKELELPLLLLPLIPIAAAASLLAFWTLSVYWEEPQGAGPREQRVLVEVSDSIYWQDMLEKKVRLYEN